MRIIRELKGLEQRFFEPDKENNLTTVYLQYEKASELFDPKYKAKMPIITLDLMEKIKKAFKLIPYHHKLILDIEIKNAEGYTEDELLTIIEENILLEYKTGRRETSRKDNLALGLITVGILSFIIMMVIGKLIPDGGLIHDIFFYISDIAATVTIWEALYILLVEDHEHRFYKRGLLRRFKEIRVHTD